MQKTVPILALLLAGCTVDGTPRLTSVERAAPVASSLPVTFDPAAPPETRQLASTLAKALGSRAVAADTLDGPSLLVSTSRAPASLGLAIEGRSDNAVHWLSPPRQKRRFDPCQVERLHASVTGPGQVARGEMDFCQLDEAAAEALARTLAQALQGG